VTQRAASAFGDRLLSSGWHVWLPLDAPLDVPLDLEGDEIVASLIEQAEGVIDVACAPVA
jgi:hypothetical protein